MIGIRAHDMGKMPAKELAKAVAEKGCGCVHLALQRALTDYNFSVGKLNPGMAKTIREAFRKEDVCISVLGCYINPVHPNPQSRRDSLEWFKEHIRFARDFGCSIVATETGSLNADCSYHPGNASAETFEALVESVRELVGEAEKFGVFVCLEGVTTHTISTPKLMKRILDRIQSNNLQVLFDLANLLDENNIGRQREIIQEAFQLYGDRIIMIHAKDFIFDHGTKISVPIGEGVMDYPFLMKILAAQKPGIEITMEDTKPEWIEEGIKTLRRFMEPSG